MTRRWPLYLTSVLAHAALVGHWLTHSDTAQPSTEIAIAVAAPVTTAPSATLPNSSSRAHTAANTAAATATTSTVANTNPATSQPSHSAQTNPNTNAGSNTAANTANNAQTNNPASAPNQSRSASAAQSYRLRCSKLAKNQALKGGDFKVTLDVSAEGKGRNAHINNPSSVQLMNDEIARYAEAVVFKPALDAAGKAIAGQATITIRHDDCS